METVVDPSASVKSSKTPSIPIVEANTKANKGRRGEREDLDRFKDSRGTGPSESSFGSKAKFYWKLYVFGSAGRRTDEGFLVYKEDELGIQDEGGGE